MQTWNVLVTARDDAFSKAMRARRPLGHVARTNYYNVLLMRVEDPRAASEVVSSDPRLGRLLSRMVPMDRTFTFSSPVEFETAAKDAIATFVPALRGKSFHVRVHRRGFRGALSGHAEGQILATHLLEKLEADQAGGRIAFDDPDAIVDIETVGPTAGASLFTRDELARHPLLHVD